MTLRVLHILSGDLWGGAEAQMGLQISAQRELGLDSRVMLFNPGETESRYSQFGVPTTVIEESEGFFNLLAQARRNLAESPAELIVSHGYKESIVAAVLYLNEGVPFISTIHGGTESYSGIKALKAFAYNSVSLFLSKFVAKSTIVPTEDLRRKLSLKGHVVGNVADIQSSNADLERLRESVGFDLTEPLVAWVGRIVPVKRVDRIVRAVEILKREGFTVNLLIVGEGDLRAENEKLADNLGLSEQIKFLGFRKDAADLIRTSDLLALTSDSEGLPTVMAEAMTGGVKLVMSDLKGIREVANRFSSYPIELVSPQTPEAFALSIKKSLSQKATVNSELLASVKQWFDPMRAAKEAREVYLNSIPSKKSK